MIKNKPLLTDCFFTVIIPLFNKEKYIYNTLKSVVSQTFTDYEVIIIDDGSTDNSYSIVKDFKDHRIHVLSQKNQGVSSARNQGIELAKGKYIAFLDGDDIWMENHLQNFVDSINTFPKEHVFCNNYSIQFSQNSVKKARFISLKKTGIICFNSFFDASLYDSIATASSICIKREILSEDFKFDIKLDSCEDIDLWTRLAFTYKFVFNFKISAIYNKNVVNSLSKISDLKSHFYFTQKYRYKEKIISSLKKYMDVNRFALLLSYKQIKDKEKVRILIQQIDRKNLNFKQKILAKAPYKLLTVLYKIKFFLDRNGIFVSVYK